MEKEKDEQLYNYTSCLRSEFKDPDRLEGCFASLNIYIASRTESINEYDETCHSSNATESSEERQNREYIDTLRERVIRAKEYLSQVEAEKNSFPPLPELPPTKPLIKISGIVEELSIKKVIGYFDFSEYSTEKARAEEKIKRDNEGASLLLLLQFFAGDAPHARFNDGKRKESRCIYVEGKVDEKLFSGWLHQTNVKVGDFVEIAAMPEDDEYKMYAIANPQTQIISTTINCYCGRKYSNTKEFMMFSGFFYTAFFLFTCLFEFPTLERFLYAILVIFTLSVLTSYFLTRGIIKENRAPGELFERICTVLEIPNSDVLNLAVYTDMKIENMIKNGEPIILKNNTNPLPKASKNGVNDMYYYPKSTTDSLLQILI